VAILVKQQPGLIRGRVIHFAPERNVADLIRPLADQYQSADLFMRGCDLVLNLEHMELPDESVDVFIASHVLEHVDDRKALAELFRCLRPGGLAVIMVPIVEGWNQSYENDRVTTERDRELHFGQIDHVRYYGRDIRDRIRDAGFELEEFAASPSECVKFGLTKGEAVFLARRPSISNTALGMA
jgi:SAM-dependent methyltransferase